MPCSSSPSAQDVTSDDQWARYFNRIRTEAMTQSRDGLRKDHPARLPDPPSRSAADAGPEVERRVKGPWFTTASRNRNPLLNVARDEAARHSPTGTTRPASPPWPIATRGLDGDHPVHPLPSHLYYFLRPTDGPLLNAAESMIPVPVDYQRHMLKEFSAAVRAVVSRDLPRRPRAGIALTLGLWFFGFSHLARFLVAATPWPRLHPLCSGHRSCGSPARSARWSPDTGATSGRPRPSGASPSSETLDNVVGPTPSTTRPSSIRCWP